MSQPLPRRDFLQTLGAGAAGLLLSGSAPTIGLAADADLPALKGEVELKVANWIDVQKRIAARKGKIVVLDVWSNYCDPCLRELPFLVTLQRKYVDDVVCMTLNANYSGIPKTGPSDEIRDEALATLKKVGAKFENYLSSVADEALLDDLGTTLPTVLVFGRDGKRAKTFNNDKKEFGPEFSYEKHIDPYVKQLVAAKTAEGK